MHLQSSGGLNLIRRYAKGQITINDQLFECSLLLFPNQVCAEGYPGTIEGLSEAHFAELVAFVPEVALIGTGPRLQFPPVALLRALIERGIGFEVMDTGAACRTYNILVGEGRRVAALLLIGPSSA